MKKLLLLATTLLVLALTGCSEDKGSSIEEKYLIGKWYVSHEKGYDYVNGEREYYDYLYTKKDTWLHWGFLTNGTMVTTNLDFPEEPLVFTFKWSLKGSVLTTEDKNGDIDDIPVKSLTSTTLIVFIEGEDEYGSYEYTLTFTKM